MTSARMHLGDEAREADLVSVVIPAYNAAATIDETLHSVRAQTYAALDVVVIDDGSKDDTAARARRFAESDPRFRVVTQANGGVAAARNHGIALSRGEFIAPVDADDLWAPTKIEKQVAALRRGGAHFGLCYTWSARIDAAGHVLQYATGPHDEGDVLKRLCMTNLMGNGSCAMMRASALSVAGLYDPSLRARKAQGCEDWDLYLRIAERFQVALTPENLTGYRNYDGNMSSDVLQMNRSKNIVVQAAMARRPDLAPFLRRGARNNIKWLITRAVQIGRWREALTLAAALFQAGPVEAAPVLAQSIVRPLWWRVRDAMKPERERPRFLSLEGAAA